MVFIQDILQNIGRYFSMIKWQNVLDILIVSFVIYKLIGLMRKSNAMQVFRGILLLLGVLILSEVLGLEMINFILSAIAQLSVLALAVIFQPELRKALEQIGSRRLENLLGRQPASYWETVILQMVDACSALSWAREGALIVVERNVLLGDIIKTGTLMNAEVTSELLKNIFYPKAPLHDGAVIIVGDRIAAAGCMLPLSGNQTLSRDLGMRHRAGLGVSEVSDALAIIVSEETGSISVAESGMLKRHLDPETLDKLLRKYLVSEEPKQERTLVARWLHALFRNKS